MQRDTNDNKRKPIRGRRGFPLAGVGIWALLIPAIGAPTRPPRTKQGPLAPFEQTLPGSVVKIQMVPIPGGTVKVGGRSLEVKTFWMATTETPWEAFDTFTSSGPPSKPYDQRTFAPDAIARPSRSYILPDLGWGHHGMPAINISSTTAEMFCRWLASETKRKFRLPSEAEWQLACQAESSKPIENAAWDEANSNKTTHPVGKKLPNKLGLFDMLGNVGEWAYDPDGKPVLCGGSFMDPASAQTAEEHKYFVPAWQRTDPQIPKSRWWLSDAPFCGFRVVCEP